METITLSECLSKMISQSTIKDVDKIMFLDNANNEAKTISKKNLQNVMLDGGFAIKDYGEYDNWGEFENDLIHFSTVQGLYFGTLNGVGIFIKVELLGSADKHYLYEISGGIEFDQDEYKKYKKISFKTSDHWHAFNRESRNDTFTTEWEVEGNHYDLGSFKYSSIAENLASQPLFAGNPSISVLRYKSLGTSDETHTNPTKGNGLIIQQVLDSSTMQYLYWDKRMYVRQINFTDDNRTEIQQVGQWFTACATNIRYDSSSRKLGLQFYGNTNINSDYDITLPLASTTAAGLLSSSNYEKIKTYLSKNGVNLE